MADNPEVPDEIFNNDGQLVASKHEHCIILLMGWSQVRKWLSKSKTDYLYTAVALMDPDQENGSVSGKLWIIKSW